MGSSKRINKRPVVDLPQPDSPTIPNVSPSNTSKETSSTAFTSPACELRTPFRIGKYFLTLQPLITLSTRCSTSCFSSKNISIYDSLLLQIKVVFPANNVPLHIHSVPQNDSLPEYFLVSVHFQGWSINFPFITHVRY